jgi:hypothetical protein
MAADGPQPPHAKGGFEDIDYAEAPPSGEEAEAQREETITPLLWIGGGLLLILAFVALLFIAGHIAPKHTGVDVVHVQQQ